MRKFFTSNNGNSWQIYLNKPVVQFLGITDKELSIRLEIRNKILVIRHIKNEDLEEYKNFLVKKLIKRGSGYGLNFSLPVLELLDINPEKDSVDITIEEQTMLIRKWDEANLQNFITLQEHIVSNTTSKV